jgi:hypothetical protein
MSCPYYWYNNHYACRKTGKDVNEDLYYKYCRNYDYGDCPIYKGQESSGCFLTSACVEAKGLPDDCHELTVLRTFRDGYLSQVEGGSAEICEYYQIAPSIVESINHLPDSLSIFEKIYNELVLPCVAFIETGKNEDAHQLYRSYTLSLEAQFL